MTQPMARLAQIWSTAKQLDQIILDPVAARMIAHFQDHPHRVTIDPNNFDQITDFHLLPPSLYSRTDDYNR
jgi:hypothetical protein